MAIIFGITLAVLGGLLIALLILLVAVVRHRRTPPPEGPAIVEMSERLNKSLKCPYGTALVADWVVAFEVQYLHRVSKHFDLQVVTILSAY
ncbi:unnamed protein product [Dibothriocephalus latus]|uniref:Uncharacterized protein n=1 Tax=Dibothriocephalus latus TaxID=60516 RepID=A0A3P6U0F1_DIBLA|nr:unnamed protein product [Dibothriocephalus latus]